MISTALLFDAVIGNVQEKAMREYRANNVEVVLYSYGIGFIYLLIVLTLSGNLLPSVRFCATVSVSYIFCCILFSHSVQMFVYLINFFLLLCLFSIPFKLMVMHFYSVYRDIWVFNLYSH